MLAAGTAFTLAFFFGGAVADGDAEGLFECIDAETKVDFREVKRSLL